MFGRARSPKTPAPVVGAQGTVVSAADMGLDTLAAVLRLLGELTVEPDSPAARASADLAEGWAQHVLIGAPPPGTAESATATPQARRDWAGVREFARATCRGSLEEANAVLKDLRQVVWVFIQNLSHTLAEDRDADGRVKDQLVRLAALAHGSTTSELKKEALATVQAVSVIVEERRRRQREQLDVLGNQVKSLGSELESARKAGETDPLTGLFNRRALDEHLERAVELRQVFGSQSCLLFVDVDHMKAINDGHGHPAGDAVLVKVAEVMVRMFPRKSDFLARYGGDELAAILRETTPAEARTLAERMVRAVRALELDHAGKRIAVTVSVGLAGLEVDQDAASWLKAADQALYKVKQSGRDAAG